jgi:hypothetical protein
MQKITYAKNANNKDWSIFIQLMVCCKHISRQFLYNSLPWGLIITKSNAKNNSYLKYAIKNNAKNNSNLNYAKRCNQKIIENISINSEKRKKRPSA